MSSFMLSPGVQITEKDFTSIVPAVSTSAGAFAGVFRWGPVLDPVTVVSENDLVQRFGAPNDGTAMSFFSAANFLAYSNNLLTVRVDTAGQRNAVATPTGGVASITVTTPGAGYSAAPTVVISAPNVAGGTQATATATVSAGGVATITVTNPGSGYSSATVTLINAVGDPGINAAATATVTTGGVKINNLTDYEQLYSNGSGVVGAFAAKYPGSLGNSIHVSMADSSTFSSWEYKDEFDGAPTGDELHIIVVDVDGKLSGAAGGILEKFAYASKASDAKKTDGSVAYYKHVINYSSKWVYWMDHPVSGWGAPTGAEFGNLTTNFGVTLAGGADDFNVQDGDKIEGFNLFANAETYDISLIVTGHASDVVANAVISNVADVRKDCVAFVSPLSESGDIIVGTGTTKADEIVTFRNELPSTSYAVMDSGYKYQYDRYNDVFRWVPLNADIAGLCARADFTDEPWFSPGGYTRGQIKNVVKLAFNPDLTSRDILYKAGVNPVVSFPGQGTVLYGDKTLFARPSAFDRINVRRLFIVLEKAIATAAKYQLFELNDAFTRAQFVGMVEPFLRGVQGRRGITDFKVVCNTSNNDSEVIDGNRFVADIYIKPTRSINFINLNFIAARSSVNFEEIGG